MGGKVEDKGLQLHQKSDKAVREAYFAAKNESYKPIDPKTGKTIVSLPHLATQYPLPALPASAWETRVCEVDKA